MIEQAGIEGFVIRIDYYKAGKWGIVVQLEKSRICICKETPYYVAMCDGPQFIGIKTDKDNTISIEDVQKIMSSPPPLKSKIRIDVESKTSGCVTLTNANIQKISLV